MINLPIPNKILHQLSKQNKYITPVTVDDLPLFQKFFKKEKHTYGNSWTYVTQGVYGIGPNNLGYKYYDGKNLSVIGIYPKLEKPELNVFYWVRPMGPTVLDVIADFSGKLLIKNSVPTYVKKIFKEQFDYLAKKGFQDTKNFPWHSFSPSEDDTHPEQIIDVAKTLNLSKTMSRKEHLRKSVIRTIQLQERFNIETTEDNFQTNAWKIAQEFFNSDLIKGKKINLSDEYDYYNMIFSNLKNNNVTKAIILVNNQPLGFYLMEQQNEVYTSLYALIILRYKLKYLVDYVIMNILKTSKTEYLNMGGSEDIGIHEFKMKYHPESQQQMYWATNYSG